MEEWNCFTCKKQNNDAVCFRCKDGSEYIKQTNADRIRSMTDEELAEFFSKFDTVCGMCSKDIGFGCFIVNPDRCKDNILDWLQSEAE